MPVEQTGDRDPNLCQVLGDSVNNLTSSVKCEIGLSHLKVQLSHYVILFSVRDFHVRLMEISLINVSLQGVSPSNILQYIFIKIIIVCCLPLPFTPNILQGPRLVPDYRVCSNKFIY